MSRRHPFPFLAAGRTTFAGAALAALACVGLAPTGGAGAVTLEELYAAAKPEGALTIVAAPTPVLRKEIEQAFSKRFPGIKVEVSGMPGGKATAKLQSEARAGVHAVDVMLTGTTTGTQALKPAGLLAQLDPLIVLPAARDPSKWEDGTFQWADPEKQVMAMLAGVTPTIVVNTEMVKPGEVTSDADLLDPKWKGKIVANSPLVPGNGNKQFRRLYDLHGEAYLRKFMAQEPMIIDDLRQAVDWVAKGRYAIGIGLATNVIDQYMTKGVTTISADPMLKWQDYQYLSPSFGGLMVPKEVPHPNTMKLFVNWVLTKEGQGVISRGLNGPSYRKDVDMTSIPAYSKMHDGLKYRESFSEAFLASPAQKQMMDLMKSLMVK